jgi:hypothetical protein
MEVKKMGKGKIYFGGIPTGPDVNRLVDAFKVQEMNLGDLIPYEKVSEIIGQGQNSSRWRSITNAWRKKIENEHNIIIRCDNEKPAFRLIKEGEKVKYSSEKICSAAKAARRSLAILTVVNLKELTEDERKTFDFNTTRSGSMISSAQLRSGKNHLPELTAK